MTRYFSALAGPFSFSFYIVIPAKAGIFNPQDPGFRRDDGVK
jgi:hypothetical protein